MANLQGYELTVTGRALLAKAGTGACTLNFTKVKLGADETSLNDLINKTDLVGTNIKQIDIVGSQANEATFTIIATVTNSGMQDNFLIRQVGIFAKGVAATNPGTGVTPEDVSETLFAVAYDTQPDIIPAESITPYTRQFNANMTVTNVEQCYVTLTPAGVVTVQVLNNHNDNSEAHGNLIKRIFGSASAAMDSVKQKTEEWDKEVCLPLSGGAMKGNINAKGYNITATKFIGNLQGKADSADNAEVATKATQDSKGRQIDPTYLKLSGGTLTGDLNVSGHNITANNITGNLQGVLVSSAEQFPQNNFREVVFGSATTGAFLKPLYSKLANGVGTPTAGISWGSQNAQGFLQTYYGPPIAIIGGGAGIDGTSDIKWYRQIAFTESPTFSGAPTAPTPAASDNSTKLATTAFVKSLFTASKQENGWWKDGNTGIILQWCKPINKGNNSFPISFPNRCFGVYATNIDKQGQVVDNSFGYVVDNSTYYYATKRSDTNETTFLKGIILAIGY